MRKMMDFCKVFALIVLSIAYFVKSVESANILAFLPSRGRSHVVPFYPLFRDLANRGHNVTLFTYYPLKPVMPNLTNVIIDVEIPIFAGKF